MMRRIIIECKEVRFSYERLPVLEDVSFHIHEGEFVALVGPNGAGKSTLIKLLLGLLSPAYGSITILGRSVGEASHLIGYVPQTMEHDKVFPIRVEDVVRMGRISGLSMWSRVEDEVVLRAMKQMEVDSLAGRQYSELSGGQRRRVLVARALAAEPELLVLDEPTANMDADSEKRFFDILENVKGKTSILIVTHDNEFVSSLVDRVLCIGEPVAPGRGRRVVEHRVTATSASPPELFGGKVLQVLHNEVLPDNSCCGEAEDAE
ncbi:ATP-binding cassette domain-containing protein [Spirochaetia bacterium 38H-sp]|uniref:ATP-binding cassette domain-containing protein n=1 Tax=Rarispira pelagica TaxID=3141764 RepID=A0ABU9U8J3_9SPIR